MKFLILLTIAAVAVAQETYTSENDDLDIEAIVASEDKLKSYNDCFVDIGSCDAVQAQFKKDMSEAVREACAKCTAAQKILLKKYLDGLQQKLPQNFEQFKNKYDPEDKYFSALIPAISTA